MIGDDAYVVVAGPSNTYGHYVATREEYGVQRYEGASTLFGPCALAILLSQLIAHPTCDMGLTFVIMSDSHIGIVY